MVALAGCSQLTQLYLTGLEAPLENCWPEEGLRYLNDLFVHDCSGVTDVTLARLPGLAPRLTGLFLSGEQGASQMGNLWKIPALTVII